MPSPCWKVKTVTLTESMTRANPATSPSNIPSSNGTTAWRISFVIGAAKCSGAIALFTDPFPAAAVAEYIKLADVDIARTFPEPVDQLLVVHVPSPACTPQIAGEWLVPPADSQAPQATVAPLEKGQLHWRPGRVLIEGKIKACDAILAAVAEFAFYEGQLRKLEEAIKPIEAGAPGDVYLAFIPRDSEKKQWIRLRETLERLANLRLIAARLEPRLYLAPRALPPACRRLVNRLRARADIESRLEAFSDRLEACEDLYEGAVDRITDHRWYRRGMLVEIAIVILLFLEVLQLAAGMMLHGLPGQ
jgi:hypothetical protein